MIRWVLKKNDVWGLVRKALGGGQNFIEVHIVSQTQSLEGSLSHSGGAFLKTAAWAERYWHWTPNRNPRMGQPQWGRSGKFVPHNGLRPGYALAFWWVSLENESKKLLKMRNWKMRSQCPKIQENNWNFKKSKSKNLKWCHMQNHIQNPNRIPDQTFAPFGKKQKKDLVLQFTPNFPKMCLQKESNEQPIWKSAKTQQQ